MPLVISAPASGLGPLQILVKSEIFKHGKRRPQVYLAANGARGVQEIAAHLKMQRQNVTPELRVLNSEGLLEIVDEVGGKDLWGGKKPIDKTLRITKFLCTEYNLDADGKRRKPVKRKTTRKKK